MTTATMAHTAPTEQEIREAIRLRIERYPEDNPLEKLRDAVEGMADFMGGPAYDVLGSPDEPPDTEIGIWMDLRPSEARALDSIYRATVEAAVEDAVRVITDRLVEAALGFARQHPDAPRGIPPHAAAQVA